MNYRLDIDNEETNGRKLRYTGARDKYETS
jgi:hypothetical protein